MNDELILRFLADWLKCLLPNMVIPRRKKHIFYITNRIDLINPKYVFAWFLKKRGIDTDDNTSFCFDFDCHRLATLRIEPFSFPVVLSFVCISMRQLPMHPTVVSNMPSLASIDHFLLANCLAWHVFLGISFAYFPAKQQRMKDTNSTKSALLVCKTYSLFLPSSEIH